MSYTNGLDKPSDYFNTVTYTGNSSATQSITGVNFQPDLVWIKQRNLAYSHILFDVVRGVGKDIQSNGTSAEDTNNSVGYLSAFDSDGFTVSQGSSSGDRVNGAYNYVAWNWLAGGTGVSNTDGSITSTVSANTTSGFSIVTYTGTGSAATVGHGLGSAPNFIAIKKLSSTGNWGVYHSSLGATKYLLLNTTDAEGTSSAPWNNTAPTSSVFTVNTSADVNGSGATYVAYCFAEKKGFSKFGSYTGNGNADGTFIYTGFKPAYILIKRTDVAENWVIKDNKTSPYNPTYDFLLADSSSIPTAGGTPIDILSNGFKIRTTSAYSNASGGTYIYMCFSEHPIVSSSGVPCTAR